MWAGIPGLDARPIQVWLPDYTFDDYQFPSTVLNARAHKRIANDILALPY
jgi:hypothetical protein